ncbi:MAG: hypothetical protein CM15mP116_08880 [Synechococcus sp.]|nr:MAG: hypothetical protein CM15mP116_08880 [Synechococcus sp.]
MFSRVHKAEATRDGQRIDMEKGWLNHQPLFWTASKIGALVSINEVAVMLAWRKQASL